MNWYYVFLIGTFLVCGGSSLIVEHFLSFGYLEFELIGHETLGAALMIIGTIIAYPYLKEKREKLKDNG